MANVVSVKLLYKPFFLQKDNGAADPIYYSAFDMRRFIAGLFPRSGILGASQLWTQQSANVGMSITVSAGYALVDNYLVHLAGSLTIDLSGFAASPASTRTHRVYVSVYDALRNGTTYDAAIDVVEDTGAGAAPPANATATMELATITIAKNQGLIQNANITNTVRHGGTATEYVSLTGSLNSTIDSAASSSAVAGCRLLYDDGIVRLGGGVVRANGAAFTGATELGRMAAFYRPARTRILIGACSLPDSAASTPTYDTSWRLQIDPDGLMTAQLQPTQKPNVLFLDGMTYDLD